MSVLSRATQEGRTLPQIVRIGAIGGAIAGMMLAMVEMVYGWVSETHTFWDAPMAIWAWVAGVGNFGPPGDHVGAIVLGIAGHMMLSMMLGVVFAGLVFSVLRGRNGLTLVMVGVAYGLVVWIAMRYVILPLNAGEADLFTTDHVSPQWVWWLSHAVLGMTAGVYVNAVRRVGRQPGATR